jgi:vacuolar protein sorting-associated protein 29
MYFSSLTTEVTPSFILLAIQGNKVVTYVYELHGDQVDVSKSEFSKA